jgi:hypothetical protein
MTLQSIDVGPASLMADFRLQDVEVGGGLTVRAATAGNGPALLLLHGHPQTHVSRRKVALRLAQRFSVVACDLRGYGDSSKPEGGGDHATYSKRVMAADQLAVMRPTAEICSPVKIICLAKCQSYLTMSASCSGSSWSRPAPRSLFLF